MEKYLPLVTSPWSRIAFLFRVQCYYMLALLFIVGGIGFHVTAQELSYEWAYAIGQTNSQYGEDVAVDSEGNLYVVGTYSISATLDHQQATDTLLNANGKMVSFLAKYNAAGEYIWSKKLGDVSEQGFIANPTIRIDQEGSLYVAAAFGDSVYFDGGTDTLMEIPNTNNSGWSLQDAFLAKYDSDGEYQWVSQIGGDGIEFISGLIVTDSGDVYITGTFGGVTIGAITYTGFLWLDGVSTPSSGRYDIFMAKYNSDGSHGWTKTMGGVGDDFALAISMDVQGKIALAGGYTDTGSIDFDPGSGTAILTSDSAHGVFLAVYDTLGENLWAKNVSMKQQGVSATFSGMRISEMALAQDGEGSIYLSGGFTGKVDFDPSSVSSFLESTLQVPSFLGTAPSQDIFLTKYSAAGDYQWGRSMGSKGVDILGGMVADENGNLFIAGSFPSATVDVDTYFFYGPTGVDTMLFPQGRPNNNTVPGDLFLAKYDISTGDLSSLTMMGAGADSRFFRWTSRVINALALDPKSSNLYLTGTLPTDVTLEFPDAQIDTLTPVGDDGFLVKIHSFCERFAHFEEVACDSFLFNDSIYKESGEYSMTLLGATGCDSTITLSLTLVASPEATAVDSGGVLTASTGDSYQWVDCNEGYSDIPDATAQTFTPKEGGSYGVVVTTNGCSDTSECIQVEGLGIAEDISDIGVRVYPNPITNTLNIQLSNPIANGAIRIYQVSGALLQTIEDVSGDQFTIDCSAYVPGIYFGELQINNRVIAHFKVLKR